MAQIVKQKAINCKEQAAQRKAQDPRPSSRPPSEGGGVTQVPHVSFFTTNHTNSQFFKPRITQRTRIRHSEQSETFHFSQRITRIRRISLFTFHSFHHGLHRGHGFVIPSKARFFILHLAPRATILHSERSEILHSSFGAPRHLLSVLDVDAFSDRSICTPTLQVENG